MVAQALQISQIINGEPSCGKLCVFYRLEFFQETALKRLEFHDSKGVRTLNWIDVETTTGWILDSGLATI